MLQAFAGNPFCGAVCTNCFEKCTYFFASITVRMIREMLCNVICSCLPWIFHEIFHLSDNYFQSCTEMYTGAHERRALGFE